MDRFRSFLAARGFPPSTRSEDAAAAQSVLTDYLAPIGNFGETPEIVITARGELTAGYITGSTSGIFIEERYIDAFERILSALSSAEHGADVARAVVRTIASELGKSRDPAAGLALLHEPVSDFYALADAPLSLRTLTELAEVSDLADEVYRNDAGRVRHLAIAFISIHEFAHWIHREHSHEENALGRNFLEIRAIVDDFLDNSLARDLVRHPDFSGQEIKDRLNQLRQCNRDLLTEEVSCDRIVSGTFYVHGARRGVSWRQTYMRMRLLQEAQRLVRRSRVLAEDFQGSRTFLETPPTIAGAVAERGLDDLYLRSYLVGRGLPKYVREIEEEFGLAPFDMVDAEVEALGTQTLRFLFVLAGPAMERTVYLILRSLAARLNDPEVQAFFAGLASRHGLTGDEDLERAFQSIVQRVADEIL